MRRLIANSCLLLLLVGCADSISGPGGPGGFSPIAPCVNLEAAGYDCSGIDLVGHVPLGELELEATPNSTAATDAWGWTDSETGRSYALVGRRNGVSIVDVTNPVDPVPTGRLPSAAGFSMWRDIKVYRDHAFVVADGSPHGIQILDLRRLRGVTEFTSFAADAVYERVSSIHNVAINEQTGFAYAVGGNGGGETCGGGLHMIDIRTPASPQFAGCFTMVGTGIAGTGYTHDVQCVLYDGPDREHRGRDICVGSNESAIIVVDVTSKSLPVSLATASYPDARYVHQGWLTTDHRYFLQNDEFDELDGTVERTRLLVWDLADLDDPVLVTEHLGPSGASDHNIYVRGDLAWQSNYAFGVRVLDVSNPRQPVELGYFDTHPLHNGPGFVGSWSNYPFFDHGVVAVSSTHDGLFLIQLAR